MGARRHREPCHLRGPGQRRAGGLRRRRPLPAGGRAGGRQPEAGRDDRSGLAGERRAAGRAAPPPSRDDPQPGAAGPVPRRARGGVGVDLLSIFRGARPRLHAARRVPEVQSGGLVACRLVEHSRAPGGAGADPSRGLLRADPAGPRGAAGPHPGPQLDPRRVTGHEADRGAAPRRRRSPGPRAALRRAGRRNGDAGPLAPPLRTPPQRAVRGHDLCRRQAAAARGRPVRRRDTR